MYQRKKVFILIILGLAMIFTCEFIHSPVEITDTTKLTRHISESVKSVIKVAYKNERDEITIIMPEKKDFQVVDFKKLTKNVEKGDKIEVVGTAGRYQGNLQIRVDEVNVINR